MKSDEHIYIVSDSTSNAIGFVKVGHRHLYYYDRHGKVFEIDPLCVLDFYVREEYQRQGFGRAVIDFMIQVFLSQFCMSLRDILTKPSAPCRRSARSHGCLHGTNHRINHLSLSQSTLA